MALSIRDILLGRVGWQFSQRMTRTLWRRKFMSPYYDLIGRFQTVVLLAAAAVDAAAATQVRRSRSNASGVSVSCSP